MGLRDRVEAALKDDHGFEGDPTVSDTPTTAYANLHVEKRDDEGHIEEVRDVKNIITEEGADYVRTAVGSAPLTSAFSWIAVGTTNPSFGSADTVLGTEIDRSAASFNTTGNFGEFSNVTTFTSNNATIKESGLFNRGVGNFNTGTMLAAQTFGGISLTSPDSLVVRWKVFFSES